MGSVEIELRCWSFWYFKPSNSVIDTFKNN